MPTKAPKPVPDGMNTVTTQLMFNGDCKQAIEFYKKAFNASLVDDMAYGPDGNSIMHALHAVSFITQRTGGIRAGSL